MNARFFTGYLPKMADLAYSPASAGEPARPRLVFETIIRDSHGVKFPEKCLIDDAALINDYQALLTAGRAVIIQGEQTARPYHKNGILQGYVREVRVTRMEFPYRGAPKLDDGKTANGEGTNTVAVA